MEQALVLPFRRSNLLIAAGSSCDFAELLQERLAPFAFDYFWSREFFSIAVEPAELAMQWKAQPEHIK